MTASTLLTCFAFYRDHTQNDCQERIGAFDEGASGKFHSWAVLDESVYFTNSHRKLCSVELIYFVLLFTCVFFFYKQNVIRLCSYRVKIAVVFASYWSNGFEAERFGSC